MPWEETQDFIRSGHRNPEEFEPDSIRTITLSEEEGIQAVIGKPKGQKTTEVVSYLFKKEKGWTLEKAKEWFKQRQGKTKESFSWAGSVKEIPGASNLIRGKALHPMRTVHPEEWPEVREYLEEELQKSAHSLEGKPLILDHYRPIRGKVLGAEYEDGAIEYVAELNDPDIMRQIVNGEIKHCSVEFEWKSLENVDGVAPRGINFSGLSLLKDFFPGDPLTTVEVWEGIIKKLKEAKGDMHFNMGRYCAKEQAEPQEFIFYQARDPAAFLEEHFSTAWIDQTNGIQGIYGRLRDDPENPQPMAFLFMKAKDWTLGKVKDWLNNHPQYLKASSEPVAAVGVQLIQSTPPKQQVLGEKARSGRKLLERIWTRDYINNLPDSAFAIILPGGETDEAGKTTPRTLRKFPHHRADGSLDLPHLRNANARVPQSDLTDEQKAKAKAHLDRHKREAGIGEFGEEFKPVKEQGEEAPEPTLNELIDSVEDALEDIQDAIDTINENFRALDGRMKALEQGLKPVEEKRGGYLPAGGRKPLKEAIIGSFEPPSSDLIRKQEVLSLLPEDWIVRAWSYGPQLLVRQLRHKLGSKSLGNSDRE